MIKNIFLLVFISVLILSCGKKGDPVFNGKNIYEKFLSTQQSTIA